MIYKFVVSVRSMVVVILVGLTIAGCSAMDAASTEKKSTHSKSKEHQAMDNGNRIRLEHVAINVENPEAMAKWYCENLGMKILRKGPPPASARFISDASENMMLEIYHNPPDAVPDYAAMDPLVLHIAFMVDDVKGTCRKLVAAGATIVSDVSVTEAGDELAMLRDPWGVPIQFLKRAEPMLRHE